MTNNNDLRTQSNLTVNSRSAYSRRLYITESLVALKKKYFGTEIFGYKPNLPVCKKFTSYLFNLLQSRLAHYFSQPFVYRTDRCPDPQLI